MEWALFLLGFFLIVPSIAFGTPSGKTNRKIRNSYNTGRQTSPEFSDAYSEFHFFSWIKGGD
jgi:hypothetical protein